MARESRRPSLATESRSGSASLVFGRPRPPSCCHFERSREISLHLGPQGHLQPFDNNPELVMLTGCRLTDWTGWTGFIRCEPTARGCAAKRASALKTTSRNPRPAAAESWPNSVPRNARPSPATNRSWTSDTPRAPQVGNRQSAVGNVRALCRASQPGLPSAVQPCGA
jgi:hypothetical protein